MTEYVFFVFFVIFALLLLFIILTRKGRNAMVQLAFGEIIKDYGVLSDEKIYFGNQKTRLLKCKKNEEFFYILETENSFFLSINFFYTKINLKTAAKLINSFSEK